MARGAVTTRARTPYGVLLLAWVALVAVSAGNKARKPAKGASRKQQTGTAVAPIAGAMIVALLVGIIGEVTPEIATGFATILVLAAALGGGANVIQYLGNLPKRLEGG